jgi:hypothetical protein
MLTDTDGLLARLAAERGAQYLVRPDGYVAYRCAGAELEGVTRYLAAWFSPAAPSASD